MKDEVKGIAIERELAGLPKLTVPKNVDIWNPGSTSAWEEVEELEGIEKEG